VIDSSIPAIPDIPCQELIELSKIISAEAQRHKEKHLSQRRQRKKQISSWRPWRLGGSYLLFAYALMLLL
jgi:hypothetical protein